MNKPIRVLQVMGTLNRGGAEAVVMNLYRAIDREKVQFDFVVHSQEEGTYVPEIKTLGGRVYSCPKYTGKNHVNYVRWWKEFFSEHLEYKILHSHSRSTASIYIGLAKKRGIKTIIHSHNTSEGVGVSAAFKRTLQYPLRYKADYFMGCSKEAGEWLFGHKIVNSSNYMTLKNAIDVRKYTYNEQIRQAVRDELEIGRGEKIVGAVGRFNLQKNPHGVIQIFKSLHDKKPNTKLLWVGDGDLRPEIEADIKESGLESVVILTGVRSDVNRLLQAMDVYIMPSFYEGLTVAAIEAQAAGLPCVLSERMSRDTAVTDLCTFLPIKDISRWNAAIEACFTMGRADTSKAIVAAGYDIETTSKWLQKFYVQMAKGAS